MSAEALESAYFSGCPVGYSIAEPFTAVSFPLPLYAETVCDKHTAYLYIGC
jgi:hypothetical protein